MSKVFGVVTGVVMDRDPLGKVRVSFPWLAGDTQSYWAPIATAMAGSSRGSWFMPEVGDEVLVAFEHGDVNHPFVIGFLWNGVDKPPGLDPSADADPKHRILKSVNGHMIEIYDPDVGGDGEAGYIRLRDSYGNEIVLGNACISIRGVGSINIEGPNVTINGRIVLPASSNI